MRCDSRVNYRLRRADIGAVARTVGGIRFGYPAPPIYLLVYSYSREARRRDATRRDTRTSFYRDRFPKASRNSYTSRLRLPIRSLDLLTTRVRKRTFFSLFSLRFLIPFLLVLHVYRFFTSLDLRGILFFIFPLLCHSSRASPLRSRGELLFSPGERKIKNRMRPYFCHCYKYYLYEYIRI